MPLNCCVKRLVLSQQQLCEQIPEKPDLIIYTDGTTKYGTTFSGYHASDDTKRMYALGMRELVTQSRQNTLTVL